MKVVNYCYPAWFRSGYFKNYITVLPVVVEEHDTTNIKDYSIERIENLLNVINETFPLEEQWIIGGTSNGGVAAFNFVAAFPSRFEGIITAPGIISEDIIPNDEWSHLKVVMAYGDQDAVDWIKDVKSSAKRIKKIVKSLVVVPLKGQGHILPIKFNVDKMYDPYFIEN
jgi:predicted esterase